MTELVYSRGVFLEIGNIKVLVWELFKGPGVKWWAWRAMSWSVQLVHLWDVQVPPLRFGSILVFRQLPDKGKKYWRNRNRNSYLTFLGSNKIILRTTTLGSQLYLTNVYFLFLSLGGRRSSIDNFSEYLECHLALGGLHLKSFAFLFSWLLISAGGNLTLARTWVHSFHFHDSLGFPGRSQLNFALLFDIETENQVFRCSQCSLGHLTTVYWMEGEGTDRMDGYKKDGGFV